MMTIADIVIRFLYTPPDRGEFSEDGHNLVLPIDWVVQYEAEKTDPGCFPLNTLINVNGSQNIKPVTKHDRMAGYLKCDSSTADFAHAYTFELEEPYLDSALELIEHHGIDATDALYAMRRLQYSGVSAENRIDEISGLFDLFGNEDAIPEEIMEYMIMKDRAGQWHEVSERLIAACENNQMNFNQLMDYTEKLSRVDQGAAAYDFFLNRGLKPLEAAKKVIESYDNYLAKQNNLQKFLASN